MREDFSYKCHPLKLDAEVGLVIVILVVEAIFGMLLVCVPFCAKIPCLDGSMVYGMYWYVVSVLYIHSSRHATYSSTA
jgi:hypothetical protein